ncbi:MAG: hypothetical protein HC904_09415 [Blastochloris sp.]|nr:hypothetical protein [Blastochloris sp.]
MLQLVDPNVLASRLWELFLMLNLQPESTRELVIGSLVAYLIMAVTLAKMHGLGGTGSSSIIIGLIVIPISVFGMMCVTAFSELLLLPLLAPVYKTGAYYGSIVAGFFCSHHSPDANHVSNRLHPECRCLVSDRAARGGGARRRG